MAEANLTHPPPSVAEGVHPMMKKRDIMWTGGAFGTIGAAHTGSTWYQVPEPPGRNRTGRDP